MVVEERDFYSISGFFIEDHTPDRQIPFGGFFHCPSGWKISMKDISGGLIDGYGESKIFGEIRSDKLMFAKEYSGIGYSILYRFQKNDGGIFVGNYNCEDPVLSGRSFCKINLDFERIPLTIPKQVHPERWARSLIESMLDEGYFELSRNPRTGEEVLKPR